jgi:phospholipase C
VTRAWRRIAAIIGLGLLVAGCGARPLVRLSPPASQPQQGSAHSASASVNPVYLLVLENKTASQILESTSAPYLSSLAKQYAVATNYSAVAHPSQPNYLALFSGSTQGVTDDKRHELDATTLADQLSQAGRTWRVFAENVPQGCFTGASAKGGPDGNGTYTRKHEPAISFRSISGDPTACANITDFSHFDPAAADFSLIAPNACHDMHDCSVATGDAWLKTFVPRILDSSAFHNGGTLFITTDESDDSNGPNRVATIVVSAHGPHGVTSKRPYDHYSLLRTIQQLLGLPCLANSCDAQPMTDLVRG